MQTSRKFPPIVPDGVSSFIVYDGVWELFIRQNYEDQVAINEVSQFGPGTKIEYVGESINDKIQSVLRVE